MIRSLRWSILFLCATSVFGIDLEASTSLNNLYWKPSRGNDTAGYTFQGSDLFWNLQGSVTQELSDTLTFKGGIEIDPVLRWRAYTKLGVALDNITLNFSPFLGVFNSDQKWFNPGFDAQVQYTWPGFMYLQGGFLTTFAPVAKTGDYYLSSLSAVVGLLMQNGIVSFHIEDKAATFRTKDGLTTVDASTKYWLDTEMFLKNFPLRWALLTGYQITGRSYITTAETVTSLQSALLGARLSWDFDPTTSAYVQGETSIFNVGWDQTVMDLPSSATLFQAVAGVRYHW